MTDELISHSSVSAISAKTVISEPWLTVVRHRASAAVMVSILDLPDRLLRSGFRFRDVSAGVPRMERIAILRWLVQSGILVDMGGEKVALSAMVEADREQEEVERDTSEPWKKMSASAHRKIPADRQDKPVKRKSQTRNASVNVIGSDILSLLKSRKD